MIEIRHLSKSYTTNNEKIEVLKDVNIELPNKGMIAIVGKSGVGKTTLLNLIGGIDCFEEGEIIVNNKNLKELKEKELSEYRRKEIGIVYQKYQLLEEINVIDNIKTYLEISRIKRREEEIEEILKELGIEGLKKRKVNELSGGQQQRVALAEVILKKPKILLCDEVTGALDKESGENVFNKLKEISKERLVIIISHQEEIKEYADIIIEIKEGKIEVQGTIESEQNKTTISNKEKETKTKIGSYLRILKGWTTVKVKRLIFLGFGLIITFLLLLFTISSSFLDETKLLLKDLYRTNTTYLTLGKEYKIDGKWRDPESCEIGLSMDDVKYINDKYKINGTNQRLLRIGNCSSIVHDKTFLNNIISTFTLPSDLWDGIEFIELNDEFLTSSKFHLVYGTLPKTNEEIVITKYTFYAIKYETLHVDGKPFKINDYQDIIGKTITFSAISLAPKQSFKVVGIIDTNIDERFNIDIGELENKPYDLDLPEYRLTDKLYVESLSNMHNAIYVKENFIEEYTKENPYMYFGCDNMYNNYVYTGHYGKFIALYPYCNELVNYIDNQNRETGNINLKENECIIPIIKNEDSNLIKDVKDEIYKYAISVYPSIRSNYLSRAGIIAGNNNDSPQGYANYVYSNYLNLCDLDHSVNSFFIDVIKNKKLNETFIMKTRSNTDLNMKIVGFYLTGNANASNPIYVSKELFNTIYDNNDEKFFELYSYNIPLTYNYKKDYKMIKDLRKEKTNKDLLPNGIESFRYVMISPQQLDLNDDSPIYSLVHIVSPIIAVFMIFASLFLISYCFSGIINEKVNDIGLLRGMGMSHKDFFILYIIQCFKFIIFFIIFSLILFYIAVYFVNSYLYSHYLVNLNIFDLTTLKFLFILIIISIFSLCSIILPLKNTFKIMPYQNILTIQ